MKIVLILPLLEFHNPINLNLQVYNSILHPQMQRLELKYQLV